MKNEKQMPASVCTFNDFDPI